MKSRYVKSGALWLPNQHGGIQEMLICRISPAILGSCRKPSGGGGGGGGSGVYSYINSIATAINGNNPTTTPSDVNSTGASLISVVTSKYAGALNLTDSVGNTYTPRTAKTSAPAGNYTCQIYDCISPTTSSTHRWTAQIPSGTGYPSIYVYVFSKTGSTPAFDAESTGTTGNGGTGTTSAVIPSKAPTGDNELFVAGLAIDHTASSVNSSFIHLLNDGNSGVNGCGAFLIQTTGASVGPTFTLSGSSSTFSGVMALYK